MTLTTILAQHADCTEDHCRWYRYGKPYKPCHVTTLKADADRLAKALEDHKGCNVWMDEKDGEALRLHDAAATGEKQEPPLDFGQQVVLGPTGEDAT